jgi:hypothetical protein
MLYVALVAPAMFDHEASSGALYCHWKDGDDEHDVRDADAVNEAEPLVDVTSAG